MNENEDPIVAYIIVRESLNMGAGKVGAQCAHAIQNILLKYFKIQVFCSKKELEGALSKDDIEHAHLTTTWLERMSRKVVLKADEKEWEALKNEFANNCVIIKDAGLTSVKANTETVMALWPAYKSTISKSIKRLQSL